jgi:peptide/nickel transport system permease protein
VTVAKSSMRPLAVAAGEPRVVRPGTQARALGGAVPVSVAVLLIAVGVVLAGPLLTPADPDAIDLSRKLLAPGPEALLGTDQLGRDGFSRLLHGGRAALLTGLVAVALSMLLATVVGATGGYFGGAVDLVVGGVLDVLLALPGLIVTLAVLGILGPGPVALIVALVGGSWASEARIVRSIVAAARVSGYVESARVAGASPGWILRRHILPSIGGTVLVLGSLGLAEVLLVVSALSFLGLGAQPPQADWGVMLADSRSVFAQAPWLMLAPGACIIGFSLLANLAGDALRDRLDPRVGTRCTSA